MRFIQGSRSFLQSRKRVNWFPIRFGWFCKCKALIWTRVNTIHMIQQADGLLNWDVWLTCLAYAVDRQSIKYLYVRKLRVLKNLSQECISCFLQAERFDCDLFVWSWEFNHFSSQLDVEMNHMELKLLSFYKLTWSCILDCHTQCWWCGESIQEAGLESYG